MSFWATAGSGVNNWEPTLAATTPVPSAAAPNLSKFLLERPDCLFFLFIKLLLDFKGLISFPKIVGSIESVLGNISCFAPLAPQIWGEQEGH